jgi:hypothetical protein
VDLAAVMTEVAAAAATVTGLRTSSWSDKSVLPPAALVDLPNEINYRDAQYGERIDDLPLILLVGAATQRTAVTRLAAYLKGTGASSVKAAVEAYAYTSADSVTVRRVEITTAKVAAIDYLAAIFHLDVYGKGN